MHLQHWQWLLLATAAAGIGLSKTGIPGSGILAVAMMAAAFPASQTSQAVGLTLPLLICADITAVCSYRREADWAHLKRLFPATAAGIVAGYLALRWLLATPGAGLWLARLVGLTLLALVGLHTLRRRRSGNDDSTPDRALAPPYAPLTGFTAGFTTMTANASGPVMVLYLLTCGLPKLAFMGTSAWFFFGANLFKLPFSIMLGLTNARTLPLDAALAPFVLAGAAIGRLLLPRIDQRAFENCALVLTVLAAIKLMV